MLNGCIKATSDTKSYKILANLIIRFVILLIFRLVRTQKYKYSKC